MKIKTGWLLLLLIPLLGQASTSVFHLKNGLTLLVKQDKRAPVVVSQVWYKVGSSYEPNGLTGISHVLEHMMFKGTAEHPADAASQLIAQNGGQENAFTSYDYTAYYQKLSKDKLGLSFKLEADRMRNLALKPADFAKEIQVVMEERRLRTEDNPQAQTYERFAAGSFIANPYHHPVIGWMDDLQALKLADVKRWYRSWYGPNNAVVVVVGDVEPLAVYKLAQRTFGKIPPIKVPQVKPRRNVKPLGLRQLEVMLDAKVPWLVMGYNVPTIKTAKQAWVPYALSVLGGVLDDSDSARLPRELIRNQQVAASVGISYNAYYLHSTVFTITATPAKNHTVAALKKAIFAQIKLIQQQPVTAKELARVKTQVIAAKVYQQDSMISQATELGSLMAVNLPWQIADQYSANIEKVTASEVQQVAQQYLTKKRLTIAELKVKQQDETQSPKK